VSWRQKYYHEGTFFLMHHLSGLSQTNIFSQAKHLSVRQEPSQVEHTVAPQSEGAPFVTHKCWTRVKVVTRANALAYFWIIGDKLEMFYNFDWQATNYGKK
jgi:hypothetical protein